jgi:lactoylglutathione lyase
MKFVHVATRTRDLDAALAFYGALGMKEMRRSELEKGKATLVFIAPPEGNFAIELVYNWGKDEGYEGGERFGHFAFDVEDIDAVLPGIVAAGGTVQREPYLLEGTGPRIAFVADPDGNPVELIQR